MSSKTISLRNETYRRLDREKRDGESFSDAIDRLMTDDENPLRELIGLTDETDIDTLRRRSAAFREDLDERVGEGR